MDRKIVMLLIGIVAIGMFALPSTLAMYSGQHNFSSGANVDCAKCHGAGDQIGDELAGGPHSSFECKQCHGFGIAENPNVDNGAAGHAATVGITCVGCHSENAAYLTDVLDGDTVAIVTELSNGAHDAYYADMADPDDACIGCHTSVGVTGNIAAGGTEGPIDISVYNY